MSHLPSANLSRPARVLVVNPASLIGGAEVGLLNLARHVPPREALLTFASPEGELSERIRSLGCPWIPLNLPHQLAGLSRQGAFPWARIPQALSAMTGLVLKIRALLLRGGFDLLHTNGMKAHFYGGPAAFLAGIPWTAHFRDIAAPGWPQTLASMAARSAGAAICNSRATAQSLKAAGARVVPNGTDLPPTLANDQEKRQLREALGLPGGPMILCVGHLAPLKGHEHLIKAMSLVDSGDSGSRDANPPFLVILGGEPYRTSFQGHGQTRIKLEALARDLGLGSRVIFTGEQRDPQPFYRCADIFCLPSLSEGFGRANLEAMAQGLPVVSTLVGGIPEVVVHQETGFLVEPGDPHSLAQELSKLIGHQDLAKKMGLSGYLRVKMEFASSETAVRTAAVWRELLGLAGPVGSISQNPRGHGEPLA